MKSFRFLRLSLVSVSLYSGEMRVDVTEFVKIKLLTVRQTGILLEETKVGAKTDSVFGLLSQQLIDLAYLVYYFKTLTMVLF